jgi:hypothetical protein
VKESLGVLGLCNCEFVFVRAFVCVYEVFVVVYVSMVVILIVDSGFWLALLHGCSFEVDESVKYCFLV